MKKHFLSLLVLLLITACGTSRKLSTDNLELVFLDDFIIPEDLEVKGTKVGGLSGIEYNDESYFLVCDHPSNPRFYEAKVTITGRSLDSVEITDVILVNNKSEELQGKTLDLEAIRYDAEHDVFYLTSEGSIQSGKDPAIFSVTPHGDVVSLFELPEYFKSSGEQKPRNNGVFEGLAQSYDGTGYWAGLELPLQKDGSKPKLWPTKSPVRITKFDRESGEALSQFVMQLEGITKIPWLYFAVNGLTELIEYEPGRFLVLERAFSAGHGSQGNTVRIFDVDAREATNTLHDSNLRKIDYTAAKKTLIFDFKNVRKELKENTIDNIEGMTFGPDLPNGNKTLLLASDNNFNTLGKQITQILLMELIIKN